MRNGTHIGWRDERGMSLVEVLVGVIILSTALLSLVGAGGIAARHLYLSRTDMHRWAALQEQVELLRELGYDGVTTDSAVVQGYPLSWTVAGTDPKKVILLLERTNLSAQAVTDTLVLYFADPSS